MSDRKFHFLDGCAILILGVLCLVISGYFFMPYIEENVGEVRAGMAYKDVRDQQQILSGVIVEGKYPVPENDPWGEPYIVETLPDDTIQVTSTGPNKTTPESGFDDDDIYSGMPEFPTAKIYRAKNRQWLFMPMIATVSWIVVSILWWKFSKAI